MRYALRFAALALLILCPIALHADPLVDVTVVGRISEGYVPFSVSFGFDAGKYQVVQYPGETDFLYSTALDLPDEPGLDTMDIFNTGVQNVALVLYRSYSPFGTSLTLGFGGSCQSILSGPENGVAPVFVTKHCDQVGFGEDGGFGSSHIWTIDYVDFAVVPPAMTPEPPTALLLSSGLLILGAVCCRRRSFAR